MSEDSKYIEYKHHGFLTKVREDLKGTNRDVCMCYDCMRFQPGLPENNCPIANLLYAVCLDSGIVAPIYECPLFVHGPRYKFTTEPGK